MLNLTKKQKEILLLLHMGYKTFTTDRFGCPILYKDDDSVQIYSRTTNILLNKRIIDVDNNNNYVLTDLGESYVKDLLGLSARMTIDANDVHGLFTDISNYVPYGVKVDVSDYFDEGDVVKDYEILYLKNNLEFVVDDGSRPFASSDNLKTYEFPRAKLILKSLSNLTADEFESVNNDIERKINHTLTLEHLKNGKLAFKDLPLWVATWFFKNHYDVFDLIGKGLAITK